MAGFTEQFIEELFHIPDELKLFADRISDSECICIWGTGVAGQMICSTLQNKGIKPYFFIDGFITDSHKKNLLGIPVISPHSIPDKAFIIIAADVKYGIHKLIDKMHSNPYCYIDPLLFTQHQKNHKENVILQYRAASDKIDMIFDHLSDERSKETFRSVLAHRAVHNLKLIWDKYDSNQYFGNDLIAEISGDFADCGAFTGDTLNAFMAQIGNRAYNYYAFEPEQNNFRILKEYVKSSKITNTHLFNIGLWDKKDILGFVENNSGDALAWKLDKNEEAAPSTIKVDSLDNILNGSHLDFIKMDIEGAELRALEGARNTISSCHPTLAISAYHELEHLWEVPLKILELRQNCQLSLRHHSWNMADTVCYGI